jgi:gamma-glutamyl phosphate reductase
MKRQMSLLIVSVILAISGAIPAFATVSNTNAQHLTGEQQSTQLLAAKGDEIKEELEELEEEEEKELDSPEVVDRVKNLPAELKLKIMDYMDSGKYEGLKRVWNLPDPTPEQRRKMELQKEEFDFFALMRALEEGGE